MFVYIYTIYIHTHKRVCARTHTYTAHTKAHTNTYIIVIKNACEHAM